MKISKLCQICFVFIYIFVSLLANVIEKNLTMNIKSLSRTSSIDSIYSLLPFTNDTMCCFEVSFSVHSSSFSSE